MISVVFASCRDDQSTITEPKNYIHVDTASRYEWTYVQSYSVNDFWVGDTSHIYIATGRAPAKYDGINFTLLNTGNYFYSYSLSGLNNECVFFSGETRDFSGTETKYIPTVVKYYKGSITTYILPSDSNSTIYAIYAVNTEKFWCISSKDVIYLYDNGNIKTINSPCRDAGYFLYPTPSGKLYLFINNYRINSTKGAIIVNEIIGDELVFVCSDTLNSKDMGLIYQTGEDITAIRDYHVYYFDGIHWLKLFQDDFEPYFDNLYNIIGGKSKNELVIAQNTCCYLLLFKDNKWSNEKAFGPNFEKTPNIKFYNDRIYYDVLDEYYYNISYLYKGKLKTQNIK